MKYAHVVSHFFGHPWAIEPTKFRVLSRLFAGFARGLRPADTEVEAAVGQRRQGGYSTVGRVGIVQIFGTIMNRADSVEECSGAVSAEKIGAAIDAAVADPGVRKILLQIDSPGGSVYGVQELAAKIRTAGASKPITAIADPVAASAAYWLASQAKEVFLTPSGMAGSIGAIMEHVDESAANEAEGLVTTLITAGEFKAEGHPGSPLGDDAKANMQTIVNSYYDAFVGDVAKGRGVSVAKVKADFGKGRMMTAEAAKGAGLVDGIRTLDSVLRNMGAGASAGDAISARARSVTVESFGNG